jgi:hypothetical protein
MRPMSVAFVSEMIGAPYDLRTANCWHLVRDAQMRVWGRETPEFRTRDAVSKAARTRAAARPLAWAGWVEAAAPEDGAVVFLSREGAAPDIHAGVFFTLPWERGVLHSDAPHGGVFDDEARLAARGWTIRRYFVPG